MIDPVTDPLNQKKTEDEEKKTPIVPSSPAPVDSLYEDNPKVPDVVSGAPPLITPSDTPKPKSQMYPDAVAPERSYIQIDRKSTRLNSSHIPLSRMPSSA